MEGKKLKWGRKEKRARWDSYSYFILNWICIVRAGVSTIKLKGRTTNPKEHLNQTPVMSQSGNGDLSRPVQRPVWPARGLRLLLE
jgi:hypothetical protein